MYNTVFKIFILVFGFTAFSYSQDFSTLWQGHYSYNDIVDVVSGENKIYAAAQNAVFSYDSQTNELTTITSVEGLSGEQITTLYYSALYQYVLIGYETGLIEVYSETENSVLSVVDILDKVNITPVNKRINHFFEHEGQVYISTDYGISVYDLERLEFGDTYFIGDGGSQITVNQVTILDNQIYAACISGNGIRTADLSNPNLIDYQQWQNPVIGNYATINTINNKVYGVAYNRTMYEINGTSLSSVLTFPILPLDGDTSDSYIIYSTRDEIYVYDENIQLVNSFEATEEFDSDFTSAISLDGDIYIGTEAFGVISSSITSTGFYTEIKPNGPLFNETFRLNAESSVVWSSFGDYTEDLVPNPIRSRGLSYYRNDVWENIPFDSLLEARNLAQIAINPFIQNQVFVSSFQDGILELNDYESTILYDETNSDLESLVLSDSPDYRSIRVSATAFDSSGLLWSLTSLISEPLKSYDPITGNWNSYDFSSIIQNPINDEFGYFDLAIDNNGTKWIGAYTNGIYAYNETIADTPLRNIKTEEQGLPFPRVNALTVDNSNQLWVGTFTGLRVLYNTSGFYEDSNPTLSSIIILEEGIAKELLEGETVTDIKVDGSNNKWIGTVDSGVFYLSPDGQTTIYHFTKDNSPLPSNRINDISIDPNNGTVYIATIKGLLSFKAGGSKTESTLEDAFVYPNPVRPEYNILGFNDLNDITKGVKVSGLTERVNIKITDIEGNLVAEAQSNVNLRSSSANYNFAIDGGTAIWNGKNLGNNVVRTGVYLILISDLDSFETKVLKVLIVQ
ncbi:ABC transporter substrate-binding protein [Winogradskyella psychrotolerans]|uniref:type IX secretion system anionic LPS delivery protein PorZ n=1 Tax=Winogradskyella psychrotolerans TaxID=1344585 RepID=UPI001C0710F7|nr:ABC transporter substrate-binding protein [Winogradskyella psychrotolerans]MBU2926957.1 ABC transporter substrate-binding protein [Winogradskyella psychrotolerans]